MYIPKRREVKSRKIQPEGGGERTMAKGKKVYQKTSSGKKFYDKNGFNRYSQDGGKTKFGSNYRLGVATKKFSK